MIQIDLNEIVMKHTKQLTEVGFFSEQMYLFSDLIN